jgi:hypothetical protein
MIRGGCAGVESDVSFCVCNTPPEVAGVMHGGTCRVPLQPSQDAWGLGLTAFELLTGSSSYDLNGANDAEVCLLMRPTRWHACTHTWATATQSFCQKQCYFRQ